MMYTKLAIAATIALVAAGSAWQIQDWRYSSEIDKIHANHARERQRLSEAARKAVEKHQSESEALAGKLSELDEKHHRALREAENEISTLRNRVMDGSVRLSVNGLCPARSSGVPETPEPSGVGDGGTCELTEASRRSYFDLRSGIERVTRQLKACQGYIRTLHSD